MPKMKGHSGAKKRFRVTKSGRVKIAHQGKNHILTKKSSKRKMGLRKGEYMSSNKQNRTVRTMIQK